MIMVQKPVHHFSSPSTYHRRLPSAPAVVTVQPTHIPGLLSLSKPHPVTPPRSQQQHQNHHNRQSRYRTTGQSQRALPVHRNQRLLPPLYSLRFPRTSTSFLRLVVPPPSHTLLLRLLLPRSLHVAVRAPSRAKTSQSRGATLSPPRERTTIGEAMLNTTRVLPQTFQTFPRRQRLPINAILFQILILFILVSTTPLIPS
ncbi:hypothetical protein BJV77DRAFT_673274 [Russula vinacea]|nr:hypothetical protein BJV77DRAFT_673274 [Russula vinacea]